MLNIRITSTVDRILLPDFSDIDCHLPGVTGHQNKWKTMIDKIRFVMVEKHFNYIQEARMQRKMHGSWPFGLSKRMNQERERNKG